MSIATPRSPSPRPDWRPDALGLLTCLAPYLLLLALVPPVGEFPYTDDFEYSAAAWHLADTGRLRFSDWPAMTLVTHAVWGALFCQLWGDSFCVLRLSMFAMSALTAGGIYGCVRKAGHGAAFAACCALTFAVNPITVSMEYSFMTDLTGAAGAVWLLYPQPFLMGAGWPAWGAYSVLAAIVYLGREIALIPYLVFCAFAALQLARGELDWRRAVALVLPFAAIFLIYQRWLYLVNGVPDNRLLPLLGITSLSERADRGLFLFLALALHLAPLAAVAALARNLPRGRSGWQRAAALGGLLIVLACAAGHLTPPYRSEMFDVGLRPTEQGGLPPLVVHLADWSIPVFRIVLTSAAVASALALTRLIDPAAVTDEGQVSPISTSLASCLLTGGLLLCTNLCFERYLVSLLPLAIISLAERFPPSISQDRRAWLGGLSIAAALGGLSLLGIQDALTRSRAFYAAAELVHAEGIDPKYVDGGFTYGGFYRFNPTYRGAEHQGAYLSKAPQNERELLIMAFSPNTATADRPVRISFEHAERHVRAAAVPFRSWVRSGQVVIEFREELLSPPAAPEVRAWFEKLQHASDRPPAAP